MLEVFAHQERQAIDFGMGPEVSVEPGELVRRHALQSGPYDLFGRIDDGKQIEQPAGFLGGLGT
jgi:hypothetical protein